MKTPEEIKKGLECCKLHDGYDDADCSQCPYTRTTGKCVFVMHDDALAYIQQLEAKAGLVDQYRWERDVAIDQLEQLGIGFGEKVESKVPKWISVEERLPRELQYVLAFEKYDDDSFEPCIAYIRANEWFTGTFASGCEVTHWMPLPEPPED